MTISQVQCLAPTQVPVPKCDEEKVSEPAADLISARDFAAGLGDCQLRDFSSDQRVIDCLKKFDFGEVPVGRLAEHVGFDQEELKMLDVFWDATFNDSWLYLANPLVTDKLGYASISDFHREVLVGRMSSDDKKYTKSRYTENIDYKEVNCDNELVISGFNFWGISQLKKNESNRGRKPKYYIVRGRAFKKMVMHAEKANAFKNYFLKVEELAILMRDIMNTMLRLNAWCEKQRTEMLIAGKDSELNKMRAQTAGLDQRSELIKAVGQNLTPMSPNGWIYIASSQIDASVNHFKLGSTTDLKSRLDVYTKTFSNPATEVFYCNFWRVYEPKVIENIAKVLLKRYHFKSETRVRQDETYIMNYRLFESIIATLCANHCGATEFIDGRMDMFAADVSEPSVVVPKPLPAAPLRIEMKITAGNKAIEIPVDISTLSDLEKTKVATEIVNAYIRDKTGDIKYDVANNPKSEDEAAKSLAEGEKLQIVWSDLHKFIKDRTARGNKTKVAQSGLKTMFSNVLAGIGSLDYRARKNTKK